MSKDPTEKIGPLGAIEAPREDLAERAILNARMALESELVPPSRRAEIALEYLKDAFRVDPKNTEVAVLLIQHCHVMKISIFSLGLNSEIEAAVENPEIQGQMGTYIGMAYEAKFQQFFIDKKPIKCAIEIRILEKMIIVERGPMTLIALASMYTLIGKASEGLVLLKEAAEQEPRAAELYIDLAINAERYGDAIRFFETHNPTIQNPDTIKRLQLAYARVLTGATNDNDRDLGLTVEEAADRYTSLGYGAIDFKDTINDPLRSEIQKSFVLFHKARRDEVVEDQQKAFREAIVVLKEVIQSFFTLMDTEAIQDLDQTILSDAITVLIEIYRHYDDDLRETERLFNMGFGMVKDRELFQDLDQKRQASLAYGLAKLAIRMNERGGREEKMIPYRIIAGLFQIAAAKDWKNVAVYRGWQEAAETEGDLKTAMMAQAFKFQVPIMESLIRFDRYAEACEIWVGGKPTKEAPDSTEEMAEYIERMKKAAQSADVNMRPIKDFLVPFYEVLEQEAQSMKQWLESIVPDGLEVKMRLKSPPSTLLKMRKTKVISIADITDLIGFRVLTETEEQAREIYQQVENYFLKDPAPKDWKTLDKPTPDNYRSLDITGYRPGGNFWVQVQVRPQSIEDEIAMSPASHNYYKVKAGLNLEKEIDENGLEYLLLFHNIRQGILAGSLELEDQTGSISPQEVIAAYRNSI